MLKVKATAANLSERSGALPLLGPLAGQFPRMQVVWADQGYTGEMDNWMHQHLGWRLEIVKRTSPQEQWDKVRAVAKERRKAGASVLAMLGIGYVGWSHHRARDRGAAASLGGGTHLCLAG